MNGQFYFVEESESRPGLTAADIEMLTSLSPNDRSKMIKLLSASGIDISQAEDAIIAASVNLEIKPDAGIMIDGAEATTAGAAVVALGKETVEIFDGIETKKNTSAHIATGPDGTPREFVRLAQLEPSTRSIVIATVDSSARLPGQVIEPTSQSGQTILRKHDPDLLDQLLREAAPAPTNIKRAVQAELKRLGCYRSGVDGVWGKGSRTALSRYYLARKTVPDDLEASEQVYRRLMIEKGVVCTVTVAQRAPTKVTRKKTAPAAKKSSKKRKAAVVRKQKIKKKIKFRISQ